VSDGLSTTEITPSDALFIGIDLGTSGVRAVAIDAHGKGQGETHIPFPKPRQNGAQVEQDPEQWWQAVTSALLGLLQQIQPQQVRALAVDATSGTVLLADANGHPLSPALMYNDPRATQQAELLSRLAPPDSPVATPSSGLAKLLWLQQQYGTQAPAHYLHQADWINGQLTGQFGFSDSNNALKSGYDAEHARWPDWLAELPLHLAALPEVKVAGQPLAALDGRIAQQFTLPEDTLVATGTTDSTASFLATGANAIGDAVTSLGSTLVLKVITAKPINDARYGIYSQPLGDFWLAGGASNSGGAVLQQFFSDAQMQQLQSNLHVSQTTGLDYYPLPAVGERFPIHDPTLAPRLEPRPADDGVFFQALLEGISGIEQLGYQRLADCGAPWPVSVRTTGGGAANSAWTQLRANRLNVPLVSSTYTQAAYGAALLARKAYQEGVPH